MINLKLIDTDMTASPSVTIRLKSSTETAGELITLQASGSLGVFTGAVATVTGPAAPDGRIQIKHGDVIEASYNDGSPPILRTADARADLLPPVITNLTITNRFGKEIISWTTDEPAIATVFYGTNGVQTLSASSRFFDTEQQVELPDLAAGVTYQFYVAPETKLATQRQTTTTAASISFVAMPAATVLLVDAYVPDDPLFATTDIPLTPYTDALDQTGISYEIWDLTAADAVSPTADDLRPFRVVIWRLSDSLLGSSTLTPGQQTALETYFNGGGAIFISSMELLSRLGATSSFRTNVLQVREFDEDVGVDAIYGEANDPISNGMGSRLDYSAYSNDILDLIGQSPNVADTINRQHQRRARVFDCFFRSHASVCVILETGQDTAGRIVFFAFPLMRWWTAVNRPTLLHLDAQCPGFSGSRTGGTRNGHAGPGSLHAA